MREVAIIGAGELGGATAHVLARRNAVNTIRLIDERGRIAEGKALDILEAAPVDHFSTVLRGTNDMVTAAGAQVVVLADPADGAGWSVDAALAMVERLQRVASHAVFVCAGGNHREVVERAVRELHVTRTAIVGSAPEALQSAVRAMIALECRSSPKEVAVSVLGVPPDRIVVAWEHATVGGYALSAVLDGPALRRLAACVGALWPPGAYALACAASALVERIAGRSRRTACAFVAPDDSAGVKMRAAALPVRLDAGGVSAVVNPPLSQAERVALDTARLL